METDEGKVQCARCWRLRPREEMRQVVYRERKPERAKQAKGSMWMRLAPEALGPGREAQFYWQCPEGDGLCAPVKDPYWADKPPDHIKRLVAAMPWGKGLEEIDLDEEIEREMKRLRGE